MKFSLITLLLATAVSLTSAAAVGPRAESAATQVETRYYPRAALHPRDHPRMFRRVRRALVVD
jgi:hypothetical protein